MKGAKNRKANFGVTLLSPKASNIVVEEAFIGWMSSAALMATECSSALAKKAKNGRGPSPCLDYSCKMALSLLSLHTHTQAAKAKKGCFLLPFFFFFTVPLAC